MLITPLEALELFQYLKQTGNLDGELIEKLKSSVKNFRLEAKFTGSRSYLRKSYTCPFYHHKELGCALPNEVKPYGCLAFNSHHKEFKAGHECYSEKELLEARENHHPEEKELNEKVARDFHLLWDKAPIPVALLEFIAADPGQD